MATLASVYSIEPNVRTPEDIVESLFRQPGEPREKSTRPRPQHKRVRASLDHVDADGDPINGAATVFGWMADEVTARNPLGDKPMVSIMDGQESLWNRATSSSFAFPRFSSCPRMRRLPQTPHLASHFD